MDKMSRSIVEKCHVLIDWTRFNPLPNKKRHNIWIEKPATQQCLLAGSRAPPRRSPLSELPDELLLHVMHDLDSPSLLCLRRTSRQFMRLFGDDDFQEYHGDQNARRWQSEDVRAVESNKELRTFRELLGRDRLCSDCLIARTGPNSKISEYQGWSEDPLHCSGCEIDHPSCAFSKKQRALPSSLRICIAREGFVRICRHKSMTWADIEREVLNYVAPARKGSVLFACGTRHERREVRFAFYGTTYRLAMANGVSWREKISKIEYDWDDDAGMPPWELDWCSERDYTWLSAEADAGKSRPPVPESYWYRQVDPESFGLTKDDESFRITWCWTKSCPNYFRCYELRRGRRVYIPCEEGCARTSWT